MDELNQQDKPIYQETTPVLANNKNKWYQKTVGIIILLVLFFPVGLYLMWKYTKWNKIIKLVITGFFALYTLSVISNINSSMKLSQKSNPTQSSENVAKSTPTIIPTQTIKQTPSVVQFTFDIPSLIGKNVDEVKDILLPYKDNTLEPNAGEIEWEMQFTKDKTSLLVTYNIKNRQVKDFFIGTDDPSGKTKDKNRLLEIGNLSQVSNNYDISFVPTIKDSSFFTGIIITPK